MIARSDIPLLIEFIPGSTLEREPEHVQPLTALPIVGNGPSGTLIRFADGRRVPLPTDQIVSGDDVSGMARVGFGGMAFVGLEGDHLVFHRVRDLRPESELSPERGRRMTLAPDMVAAIFVDGRLAWPAAN